MNHFQSDPLIYRYRRLTVSLLRGEHSIFHLQPGIIVTHDAVDAMYRQIRLLSSEGQIVQFDKPDQIYENPAFPVVN